MNNVSCYLTWLTFLSPHAVDTAHHFSWRSQTVFSSHFQKGYTEETKKTLFGLGNSKNKLSFRSSCIPTSLASELLPLQNGRQNLERYLSGRETARAQGNFFVTAVVEGLPKKNLFFTRGSIPKLKQGRSI